jgi:regulator of RNase E activity RraA
MAGYAVTARVDASTPGKVRDQNIWMEWIRSMERAPKPCVLVFQDVGPDPSKSAHFGEVMATTAHRLGVVGLVTDGGVRDLNEVTSLGFHLFAAGLVPSHGAFRILEVNVPVTVDGVRVNPGDLLHGDVNGVTTIPHEIVADLPEACMKVRQREAGLMAFINSPEFSVDGLEKRWFTH